MWIVKNYEVKWALGNTTINKASGVWNSSWVISNTEDDVIKGKCCTQYARIFGKLSSGQRTGKCQFFILIPKKVNSIGYSNYHITWIISYARKVMFKILQARLQQTVHEPRTCRCTSWLYKRQRNQRSNCQQPLDHREGKGIPEKHPFLLQWLH